MKNIFLIVEGHGEVRALPVLIRRILYEYIERYEWNVMLPYRISRSRIVKFDEDLYSAVCLGVQKIGADPPGAILILIDADSDCPVTLSKQFQKFIVERAVDGPVAFVVANREYESWFLASADTMQHHGAIQDNASRPDNSEEIRDAKGYFSRQIMKPGTTYAETIEQEKFSALIDIATVQRRSRSFQKLIKELDRVTS